MDPVAPAATIGAVVETVTKEGLANIGFYHAFIASFSVIIVSEIGDKTWFIAAIMAMRHSRLAVFIGAMTALALMTILSACLGWITQVIPRQLTFYISTALFALFGLKMLHEGYHMSPNQDEYEEAQAEVQKKDADMQLLNDVESGGVHQITLVGGVVFIMFALSALFIDVEPENVSVISATVTA